MPENSGRDLPVDARLTRWSWFVLLAYGLSILLVHLGDRRVLTRHEVLAAEPGREMLHDNRAADWMLPPLAGTPRTAKPPGMMWLIAGSFYIFRDESEFFARLPSALAGLAVALMIAKLTARWYGNRLGRLAGLCQLSFVYVILQAKLSEADMTLTAAVCLSMICLAAGILDSPVGVDERRRLRVIFYLAGGAMVLLKGPIGVVFVVLTLAALAIFHPRRGRIRRFLADPIGIVSFVILVAVWPIIAWRLDPAIVGNWNSEAMGAATGVWGKVPFYYYLGSVPVMMLPWFPLTVIGLWRGPNPDAGGVRRLDPFNLRPPPTAEEIRSRSELWRFLLCWFIPGLLFLSFGMQMKHHHYTFPILPALTAPTALGMDFFVRYNVQKRLMARFRRRIPDFTWLIFLLGCCIGALVIWRLPQILPALKRPALLVLLMFTCGGLLAVYVEKAGIAFGVLFVYFATAWAVAIGVQSLLMPAQDDFRYQTEFARAVNGSVPPGEIVYLLGHREEEQEAQYAYYLRFPMQRLDSVGKLPHDEAIVYAVAPEGMMPELVGVGKIQVVTVCPGLRVHETEGDRLRLLRIAR
jgi:4-amino-4-deoxy-L-arabinose transferase-like glycosyltransferase